MTHRTTHAGKLNGHGERERFEKWLLTPAKGLAPKDGGEYQQKVMRQNLERAAEAPFSLRTRLRLMENVFSTLDPEKSLSILKGLCAIVESTGSFVAKDAYKRLSSQWLKDSRISSSEPLVGAQGFAFILKKAMEVPTERSVAFPPRMRMCGWEDHVIPDDVEDVFF